MPRGQFKVMGRDHADRPAVPRTRVIKRCKDLNPRLSVRLPVRFIRQQQARRIGHARQKGDPFACSPPTAPAGRFVRHGGPGYRPRQQGTAQGLGLGFARSTPLASCGWTIFSSAETRAQVAGTDT